MKTKHLFYSLALSAAFAACSQEEIVSQQGAANTDLESRPVVGNVTLDFGEAESRGTTGDRGFNDIAFVKGEDGFGARIIDSYAPFTVPTGYTLDHAYRNYQITPTYASSNYKYVNNGGNSWITDALMVEGNYLFYYPYNEANLARTPNKVVLPMTQIVKPNEEDGYRNPIKDLYEGENPAIVGYAFLSATDQDATVRPALNHIFAYPQFTFVNNFQVKNDEGEYVGQDITITKILVESTNFVKNYELSHEGIQASLRNVELAQQKKANGTVWASAVPAGTWNNEKNLLKNAKTSDIADAKTNRNVDGTIEVVFEGGLDLAYGEEYAFNLVMPAAEYDDKDNLNFTVYLSDDKMFDGEFNVDPNNFTTLTYAPSKRFPTEEYNFPTNGTPSAKDSKGTLGTITFDKDDKIVDAKDPAQIIDNVEEFENFLKSIVDNTFELVEIEKITTGMAANQFVLARDENGVADMKIDATVVELVKKYLSEGTVKFNKSKMIVAGGEETVELSQMEFNKGVCFETGTITASKVIAEGTEISGDAVVTIPDGAVVALGNVVVKGGELVINDKNFLGKDAHNVTVTNVVEYGVEVSAGKVTINAEAGADFGNNFNGLTMNAGKVVIAEEAAAHIGQSANENITAGTIVVDGTLNVWSAYEIATNVYFELNGEIDLTTYGGGAGKIINYGSILNNSDLIAENKLGGKIEMGDVSTTLKVSGNGGVVNNTVLAEVKVTGDNQTVYAKMSSVEDMESNNFDSSASINKIIVTGLWTIDGPVAIVDDVKTIEFNGGGLYVNGSSTFDISKQNVIIAADTEWNGRTTGVIKTGVAKENFKYEYLSAKARNAKLTIGNVQVKTEGAEVSDEWGVALSQNALKSINVWDADDNAKETASFYGKIRDITVYSAQDLLSVFELINNGKMTGDNRGWHFSIKLGANIDFNGLNWTPLRKANLDIDGQNFVLSNVKIEDGKAGLFGYTGNSVIKNLTLKNVTVTGYQAGAFVGNNENATIQNCKLVGAITVNFKKAGVDVSNGVGAAVGVISGSKEHLVQVDVTNADIVINKTGITYANGKSAETNELVGVVYGTGSYTTK